MWQYEKGLRVEQATLDHSVLTQDEFGCEISRLKNTT